MLRIPEIHFESFLDYFIYMLHHIILMSFESHAKQGGLRIFIKKYITYIILVINLRISCSIFCRVSRNLNS